MRSASTKISSVRSAEKWFEVHTSTYVRMYQVQFVPYRSKLNCNDKIDNRKKKQDVYNDLHTLWNNFFQPNLTNEGFKEREEDPLLIRRVERGTRIL